MQLAHQVLGEDLDYDVEARSHEPRVLSERRGIALSRQLSGGERRSRQARYSRRSAPKRMAGTHRRGNKHHGL